MVLKTLEKKGLTVEHNKCKFSKSEVDYLKDMLSKWGDNPRLKAMEGIEEAPYPNNKEELLSFLGMAQYYNTPIEGFTKITKPLRELLKKNVKFEWKESHELAVKEVKRYLIGAPLLRGSVLGRYSIITVNESCK
ncbi:uncharacterized protein [Ambystoma mexicanum]|uniref:uncharacterized protein n=1 Tax=Ambystoma mexicanum TaxID=8296 RepID=UPI0037E813C3